MPPLTSAPFEVLSDNTTSANADLRPRLLAGTASCFFLIFSVFARRYESSSLTARWGCGDGYPDRVTVALVTVDTLLELVFIDERHNLRENCFSFVHGLRMASYRRPQSSEVLIEKFSKPRKLLKSNS